MRSEFWVGLCPKMKNHPLCGWMFIIDRTKVFDYNKKGLAREDGIALMRRLVFGILAHVDSGKTTLSESLLYCAGAIRKLGRVDHKDAFLDTHSMERDRGITIFSKQAVLTFDDITISLLDTPGHIDFSTETERTLSVLDYAILVVSGTDGVQSHTETLWKLLERYEVPTFIFVNKMDLDGSDREKLSQNLKKRLHPSAIDYSVSLDLEGLSCCDESLLEEYLETENISVVSLKKAIKNRKWFPVFYGSALKMEGINEFVNGVLSLVEEPSYSNEFGAKVYKISEDEQGNRLTHMKITGGSLKVKSTLLTKDSNGEVTDEKINQIRIYSGQKFQTADEVFPGTVCAVTGLEHFRVGDGIGKEENSIPMWTEPVLSYRVGLPEGVDVASALAKLRLLEQEDPQLHIFWNQRLKEIQIQLMGEVQLEVLKAMISQRFGIDVSFGQGSITYKETISSAVEGVGHYEPLRHYAEVHLLLEPLPRGSGLCFTTSCSEDDLDKNWQRLILTHLYEKTHLGVLTGSPITDMQISLIAGRAHKKHTEGGDFRQATYRAVRQGLMCAESILLEPWYEFELEIPADAVGRAMTDISYMGGTSQQTGFSEDRVVLSGEAPVSKMWDYHSEVIRYTHGTGRLICRFKGYEVCKNAEEVIEEFCYNPENDTENTPDSVFCSHGAGFYVKWNQVRDYMHLDGAKLSEEDEVEDLPVEKRARRYLERVYGDEELLAVFEKTYGPIRRREYEAANPAKRPLDPTPKYKPAKQIPKGPEYLLVDGYNIIFAWEDLKKIAAESLEAAREHLIDRLCNYQGFTGCELIVVFDAYKVKNNPGEVEKIHNISVVYTKEAETADMYIEKATKQLGKHHKVRVATSDNLEQLIIIGHGAMRISADAFLAEVKTTEAAIREILEEARERGI